MCDPKHHLFVATAADRVVGLSVWRIPKGSRNLGRDIPLSLRVLGVYLRWYDWVKSYIYPLWLREWLDPRLRPLSTRLAQLTARDGEFKAAHEPKEVANAGYWQLTALGVSPDYQNRGLGAKLLQPGFELAKASNDAIFVIASGAGERLYKKNGFNGLYSGRLMEDEPGGGFRQSYLLRPRDSERGYTIA